MPVPWLRDAGWRAGSPIAVYALREYNAESTKQGRKRLTSIVKTIDFDHLAELGTRQFFSFATTTTRQRNIASGTSQGPEKIEK